MSTRLASGIAAAVTTIAALVSIVSQMMGYVITPDSWFAWMLLPVAAAALAWTAFAYTGHGWYMRELKVATYSGTAAVLLVVASAFAEHMAALSYADGAASLRNLQEYPYPVQWAHDYSSDLAFSHDMINTYNALHVGVWMMSVAAVMLAVVAGASLVTVLRRRALRRSSQQRTTSTA